MSLDQLAKENQQLRLAINELKIINDIATAISSTQPLEKVIDQIVFKCIKHLEAEEGTISLLEEGSEAQQFHTMIRHQDSTIGKVPIKLDDRLKGWMLNNKSILLSNNIRDDPRFKFLDEEAYSFRSILCVPLMIKGDLKGYLATFNKKNGDPFSEEDRRLLSIIGSQSAQVIENARLYEEEKALISLQEELRLARDIQLNLLPKNTPEIPGIQIAATNLPAKSIGGDYYDFLSISYDRLGFCIGDITGKGMPAAMLMANLQATFRSQVLNVEEPDECLEGTNKLLYRNSESTKFATFFYGVLNPETGILEYANGGHDAPLLFRDGSAPLFLKATGLLLGAFEDAEYDMATISLQPKDLLLLYTDGITEAKNKNDNEFGLDRLIQLTSEHRQSTASEILDTILKEVQEFTNKTPQSDDITLMVIKNDKE
ncbi:SpoIIE family protein phosphatase [Aliifodinibius sp. S!AR15-10]|uniref:GAF domain-containing SpoIIE family protein phosphatase n=1 Tax=Aliifodinibius sp. S!AR15-10 TaxID=2950437 RepID=UPI002859E782|nr:SpoIIE family protein phosphatase [Aliifodinibius sp. S!AR15-10]MDR8390087.1 SpoIIE family protein phosphatase [Aliifodinibius sp. S!AR15-10]